MELLNKKLLDKISEEAQENLRLRMNYNLHNSLEDSVQQLLNALEPGTILPIHRHFHTTETYIVLRGKLRVMFYADDKQLVEEKILDPQAGDYGIYIPAGQWHTLEVLESGTVIFEVKEGPYKALEENEILK